MRRRSLNIAAAVIVAAILFVLSWTYYAPLVHWMGRLHIPYRKPGTVWTDAIGMLPFGTDLILWEDGTFASTNVCDICRGDDFVWGRWRDDGARILLVPEKHPDRRYVLVKEKRHGCEFLRDDTARLERHPTFVRKSSNACIRVREQELEGEHQKLAPKARQLKE